MAPGDGASGNVEPDERSYRWTCPFCGESQHGLAASDDPETEAVNQLLGHVPSTDDDGHGSAETLPDDRALEEPLELVETTTTNI